MPVRGLFDRGCLQVDCEPRTFRPGESQAAIRRVYLLPKSSQLTAWLSADCLALTLILPVSAHICKNICASWSPRAALICGEAARVFRSMGTNSCFCLALHCILEILSLTLVMVVPSVYLRDRCFSCNLACDHTETPRPASDQQRRQMRRSEATRRGFGCTLTLIHGQNSHFL